MENMYIKFLNEQKIWINDVERRIKKSVPKYVLLEIAGCTSGLAAIGLISGGGITAALQNAGLGFAFGFITAVITALVIYISLPGKKYMKALRKELDSALRASEREDFASQMLGDEETNAAKCISWINTAEKLEYRVYISKDYLLQTSGRGTAGLVKLCQTEKMELCASESTIKARGNGMTVSVKTTDYPIHFYYKSIGEIKGNLSDAIVYFPTKELRDEALKYIGESSELTYLS